MGNNADRLIVAQVRHIPRAAQILIFDVCVQQS
jgi:hypothetical protein